jgi:hypothetical protein
VNELIYSLERRGPGSVIGWDQVRSFILVASTPEEARERAGAHSMDEGPEVWRDPLSSSCKPQGRAWSGYGKVRHTPLPNYILSIDVNQG